MAVKVVDFEASLVLQTNVFCVTQMEATNVEDFLDLEAIPQEVLFRILLWLDVESLIQLALVDHTWYGRAVDNRLWKKKCARKLGILPSRLVTNDQEINSRLYSSPPPSTSLVYWKYMYFRIKDVFPTCFTKRDVHHPKLLISHDGMSATFTGQIGGDQVVFANRPFAFDPKSIKPYYVLEAFEQKEDLKLSTNSLRINSLLDSTNSIKPPKPSIYFRMKVTEIAYYEITIKPAEAFPPLLPVTKTSTTEEEQQQIPPPPKARNSTIAVGLAPVAFPSVGRQPGWIRGSYGFHSDDGKIFPGTVAGLGRPYNDPFGLGDTIGCGINFLKREIFFTKNGKFLGNAFMEVPETELWPVIGIDSNETVTINFGAEPFLYNFEEVSFPAKKYTELQNWGVHPTARLIVQFLEEDEWELLDSDSDQEMIVEEIEEEISEEDLEDDDDLLMDSDEPEGEEWNDDEATFSSDEMESSDVDN